MEKKPKKALIKFLNTYVQWKMMLLDLEFSPLRVEM